MGVTIRKAKLKDLKVLHQIQKDSHTQEDLVWGVLAMAMERLRGGVEYVIEVGSEAIGFLHVKGMDGGKNLRFINLCILPEYRGEGYGREVLLIALEKYRKEGYQIATAKTSEANTPTLKMCAGLGFVGDGKISKYYKDGTDAIVLLKELHKGVGGGGMENAMDEAETKTKKVNEN